MKRPIPKSINKWEIEIDRVFKIAFKGFPMKTPEKVSEKTIIGLVKRSVDCYKNFRKIDGASLDGITALNGSEKYYLDNPEISTDFMVIAGYLFAHEFNGDLNFEQAKSIYLSLTKRLNSKYSYK